LVLTWFSPGSHFSARFSLTFLASFAQVNLIMEIMKGGELFDYIIDRGRLEEEVSRGIVEQVLQVRN
jgi:serine/threonine protein kinase